MADASVLPCIHYKLTIIYNHPNGRWFCDTCGKIFSVTELGEYLSKEVTDNG